MSKPYESPKAELIYFAVNDVVLNSPDDDFENDIDW